VREARQGSDSAAGTARVANVTGKQAQERDDKLRLLVLFRRFWDTLGGPLCPAMEAFCQAWGDGRIDAPPALRERFPTLRRWKTVLEWWTSLDRHGAAALTRPPSHRAGRFEVLEGELGQIVLAILHDYPHLGATQIRRLVAKSGQFAQLTDASLPSDRAFRRAIAHWKRENAQVLTLVGADLAEVDAALAPFVAQHRLVTCGLLRGDKALTQYRSSAGGNGEDCPAMLSASLRPVRRNPRVRGTGRAVPSNGAKRLICKTLSTSSPANPSTSHNSVSLDPVTAGRHEQAIYRENPT
jgi:hypothetical protein